MRMFRWPALILAGIAAAGLAWATMFRVDLPPIKYSPKVERLSLDDMFNICGFEKQDTPFFTDKEYRQAIYDYGLQLHQTDPASDAARRLEGLITGMKECRENDRNKTFAKRAGKSCKELVKQLRLASERAWNTVEWADRTLKREINTWGERFTEPLEKCLSKMPCRLDNKKDMQQALEVYRAFHDDLLSPSSFPDMKICGVTVRNLKRWCTVSTGPNSQTDICVDRDLIRIGLQKADELPYSSVPSVPPPSPGGGFGTTGGGR